MQNRVTREAAAILVGTYLLTLRAHVELPALAPFAAMLSVLTVLSSVLLAHAGCAADVAVGSADTERAPGGAATAPQAAPTALRSAICPTADAAAETVAVETMRTTLRGLEAELHALEDQHLTELARGDGARR